ncbi:MAG: DegV family protein [Alkalibacterium sp.]|nr:DegV family protein [Alkalibacterium sp.]
MRIAIVTDSTAYLNEEEYKQDGVYFVPLSCIFGKEIYKEEVDITTEAFFEKVAGSEQLPTSSQPTVGDFTTLYERLQNEYDAIISIHLSSRISGTYQNAFSVAKSMDGISIYPFDSGLAGAGLAFQVKEAARLAKQGESVNAIIERLEELKTVTQIYFVVDDVTNLIKGGRISKAAGGVATLLKIKPVLTMRAGEIVPQDKIRTKKKAMKKMENLFEESVKNAHYPIQATVVHAYCESEARQFMNQLESKYPTVRFNFSFLGPVVGVHTGEGAIGMSWTKDYSRM